MNKFVIFGCLISLLATATMSQAQVPTEPLEVDFAVGDRVLINTRKKRQRHLDPIWAGDFIIDTRILTQNPGHQEYRYEIKDKWYFARELAAIIGGHEEARLKIGQQVYFWDKIHLSYDGPHEILDVAYGPFPLSSYQFFYKVIDKNSRAHWLSLKYFATVE